MEVKGDIKGGRLSTDKFAADKSARGKHFRSLGLHPSGELLMGCGNSKHICVYYIQQRILLARFVITENRSLDGVLDKLNSGKDGQTEVQVESDSDYEMKYIYIYICIIY